MLVVVVDSQVMVEVAGGDKVLLMEVKVEVIKLLADSVVVAEAVVPMALVVVVVILEVHLHGGPMKAAVAVPTMTAQIRTMNPA